MKVVLSNTPKYLVITTVLRKPQSREQLAKGHDVLLEIDWQGAATGSSTFS